jgi:type II secretory pathway pseudopilin PulG
MIELMIVVAIVAVLAAVVVPYWVRDSRKGKYAPEVTAMFTEISSKEEAYKSENNGAYLPTLSCPAAPAPNGQNFNTLCVTGANAWQQLRVSAPDSAIRCTYLVAAGSTTATVPTSPAPPAPFAFFAAPVGPWYYIVATCDMAGQGGTNATFFQSSIDTQLQKANYGS